MSKIIIILIAPFISIHLNAQSTDWLLSAGGKHSDCGSAISVDSKGNIYLAGHFQGESLFGSVKLTSKGDTDIFLAKYDSEGKLIWIKQGGSNYSRRNSITEYATSIAIADESVYVTGVFNGIAKFEDTQLISAGKEDIFIAKYDFDGELIWIKRAGGSSQDLSYDLKVDANGDLYLTGYTQKDADFGQFRISAQNQRDFFIAKYSANGEPIWVKNSKSEFMSQGKSIVLTNDGVIVGGDFYNQLDIENFSINASGPSDGFLTKYSAQGVLSWTSSFGSEGLDQVNDMTIVEDYLYITGSFISNLSSDIWKSIGARDGYIAKLNLDGIMLWNKSLGGTENDEGISLSSIDKRVFVSGKFSSNFDFKDEVYLSNGFTDIFLAEVSEDGSFQNIKVIGGTGQDYPTEIFAIEDDIFLTGLFRNQITTTMSSSGASDIFLSRIKADFNRLSEERITYLVYPNPADEGFWIETNDEIKKLEVIGKDGRIIDSFDNVNSTRYRIEIGNLASGIYYIRINDSTVKKVIIM